ncbi:hypothetical protein [Streptomyces erythrochromogenes]|uniref:hypothetical protein n=1 Tax=Streptomyces erythrochromogenes TaxID=285574 RepID=UPI00386C5A60|nr:hypothetical protein OG364_01065 [Streptomyces erythrochromogenes]WST98341.1 hypothetical protein OG364_40475 [Streptomyces erythrochromogenes]
MPNTSSVPVLQGRGATVLTSQDGLVLERRGEKLTIPTRAVAGVRAERIRRSTRIEDAAAATAVAFADAVNTLLHDLVEDLAGGALVDVRTGTEG